MTLPRAGGGVAVHRAAAARNPGTRFEVQCALGSRTAIDQAIGLLCTRTGGSAAEALHELRRISQSENAELAVIAQRVLDEAVRSA